jgi:DNA polymerase-1
MFNKPVSEITKDSPERQIAKSCSFGILYGTGPNNLAEMINSTKEDAANKIKIFMDRFPQVQAWINKIHQDVFNYGYVDTPFGRKRRLPTIWSSDNMAVSSAKRQAQNSPIQATASDLNLWLFMYIVHKMDTEKAIPVCTVHDSGVFIIHNSYVDDFILLLKEGEEKLNKIFTFLKVPVIIDIQKGQRWGDMKDISGKENSEEEKEELENEIGLESISE